MTATDAVQMERAEVSAPERKHPELYVAFCGTCKGLAGASANRDHLDATAGFVATMILDGHAVISCAARDDYLRLSDGPWCECKASGKPYHQDGPPDECPKCHTTVWEAKKRNTCLRCSTRWTSEKSLTLYKVTEFPPKRGDTEQVAMLAAFAPAPPEPASVESPTTAPEGRET
jgi:hypothetical protein